MGQIEQVDELALYRLLLESHFREAACFGYEPADKERARQEGGDRRDLERIVDVQREQRLSKEIIQACHCQDAKNGGSREAADERQQHDQDQVGKGRGRKIEAEAETRKCQNGQASATGQGLYRWTPKSIRRMIRHLRHCVLRTCPSLPPDARIRPPSRSGPDPTTSAVPSMFPRGRTAVKPRSASARAVASAA